MESKPADQSSVTTLTFSRLLRVNSLDAILVAAEEPNLINRAPGFDQLIPLWRKANSRDELAVIRGYVRSYK